jgi:hypothetical protein
LLLAALAAVACQPAANWTASNVGVVIAVDGPSVAEVDRITLRQAGGAELEFVVGVLDVTNGGLAAPHLRDHLVSGEPIRVYWYDDMGGTRAVLVRYEDAAE